MENEKNVEIQKGVILASVKFKSKKIMGEAMAKVFNEILDPAFNALVELGLDPGVFGDELLAVYTNGVMEGVNIELNKAIGNEEGRE